MIAPQHDQRVFILPGLFQLCNQLTNLRVHIRDTSQVAMNEFALRRV